MYAKRGNETWLEQSCVRFIHISRQSSLARMHLETSGCKKLASSELGWPRQILGQPSSGTDSSRAHIALLGGITSRQRADWLSLAGNYQRRINVTTVIHQSSKALVERSCQPTLKVD